MGEVNTMSLKDFSFEQLSMEAGLIVSKNIHAKADSSKVYGMCGSGYSCSGGGGSCGSSYNCTGGGGKCGSSYNCTGGGGRCGSSYNCSGS